MRWPTIRFTTERLMLAIAIIAVGLWAFAEYQRNGTYYASGWWDAELELWRGDATIYQGGGLVMGDSCSIDPETGLPTRRCGGCVSRVGDREWVNGHNDHIAQYIRWHGLPRNSLRAWLPELFHLYRSFEDASQTHAAVRLLADGPTAIAPDGGISVRLISGVKDNGGPGGGRSLIISAGNLVLNQGSFSPDDAETDLHWGPANSRLVIIRSIVGNTYHYEAYDLRTGRCLRTETWDEWRRGYYRDGKPFPSKQNSRKGAAGTSSRPPVSAERLAHSSKISLSTKANRAPARYSRRRSVATLAST